MHRIDETQDYNAALDRFIDLVGADSDVQLAEMIGVGRSTVGAWRQRGTVPIRHYLDYAVRKNINLNWLLLGVGPRLRTSNESKAGLSRVTSVLRQAQKGAEENLGLGAVASVARLGSAGGEWALLRALVEAHPDPMSLPQMSHATGESEEKVLSYLALLLHIGAVAESDEPDCFKLLRPEGAQIRSAGVPDLRAQSLFAAKQMLQSVLPAAEEGRGRFVLLRGRIGKGKARPLMTEIAEWVKARCLKEGANEGSDESFDVVLGVAAVDRDM